MKKIAFSQKRCTNFNADFCTKCQKTQKTISKTIQKSILNFVQKHNKKQAFFENQCLQFVSLSFIIVYRDKERTAKAERCKTMRKEIEVEIKRIAKEWRRIANNNEEKAEAFWLAEIDRIINDFHANDKEIEAICNWL